MNPTWIIHSLDEFSVSISLRGWTKKQSWWVAVTTLKVRNLETLIPVMLHSPPKCLLQIAGKICWKNCWENLQETYVCWVTKKTMVSWWFSLKVMIAYYIESELVHCNLCIFWCAAFRPRNSPGDITNQPQVLLLKMNSQHAEDLGIQRLIHIEIHPTIWTPWKRLNKSSLQSGFPLSLFEPKTYIMIFCICIPSYPHFFQVTPVSHPAFFNTFHGSPPICCW